MFNKSIVTGLLVILLLPIQFSAAAPVPADQVPDLVDKAARAHLARWTENSGLVEPQFNLNVLPGSRALSACGQALTVEAADTRLPARMRFIAVCAGANGWRYEFIVRAQVSARIAVVAADVPSGKVLTDEDVLLERHDISGLSDSISELDDAVGMSSKRALRAGEVLRKALLSAPTMVKRGDPVRIVARRDEIEVSMAGEALDAGAKGTTVRVRNASGTLLRARVTGIGTVEPLGASANTNSPSQ